MGADIKLLRFDWEPVAGAAFYQLKYRPSGNSAYQLVGERIPATITQTEQSLAVHLQDWAGMRFIVAACNSAGCTNSAALNPRSLMLETIGYLKASNTDPDDGFGRSVVLSDDGYTLAVTAWLRVQRRQRRQRRSDQQPLALLRRGIRISPPRQQLAPGGLSQGGRECATAVFRHRLASRSGAEWP